MVFDLQPRLASELLMLRPLSAADFDPLYAVAADPAVWEQHPSKDRTEEPAFTRWFDDALACGGALVAVDRATGEVFGTWRFVLHGPDEAEIGWTFLARSRWGGLWNREMKRLMLKHAFDEVQQVRFTVHSENTRSVVRVRAGAVRWRSDRTGTGPLQQAPTRSLPPR